MREVGDHVARRGRLGGGLESYTYGVYTKVPTEMFRLERVLAVWASFVRTCLTLMSGSKLVSSLHPHMFQLRTVIGQLRTQRILHLNSGVNKSAYHRSLTAGVGRTFCKTGLIRSS